jgi:hypothetical protein
MRSVLFLPSSPHHVLWCLGLAAGPFRDARCVLAQIACQEGRPEYLLEALQGNAQDLFAEVRSFPKPMTRPAHRFGRGRQVIGSITDWAREIDPQYVVAGSDMRPEFYAALRGAPRAIGAYIDDGWGTYRTAEGFPIGPWRAMQSMIAVCARRLTLGVWTERPVLIGGSRAAREAWVMVPERVHAALSSKIVRPIEPAWFRDPRVVAVCRDAIGRAGLDPGRLTSVGLVMLLPWGPFVQRHPELREMIDRLIGEHTARGVAIAYKQHPRVRLDGVRLPSANCFEIPQRLPAEILATVLGEALVVGVMTSALIFLPRLQPGIRVQALVPQAAQHDPITRIYRAMGVGILGSAG